MSQQARPQDKPVSSLVLRFLQELFSPVLYHQPANTTASLMRQLYLGLLLQGQAWDTVVSDVPHMQPPNLLSAS